MGEGAISPFVFVDVLRKVQLSYVYFLLLLQPFSSPLCESGGLLS